jgi:hypothetical protein
MQGNQVNPGDALALIAEGQRDKRADLYLLRIHSWCAAFVDWCVLQLLLQQGFVRLPSRGDGA